MSASETLSALFASAWGASLGALDEALELDIAQVDVAALADARAHVESLSRALLAWLWSRNQFVELDADARDALHDLIDDALTQLANQPTRAALRSVLARHRTELAGFVREHYGAPPREVVSAEYTPELQLAVLGVSLSDLEAPVLDIGCGREAALVRYLRAQGIDARGIDRVAPLDVAMEADWLDFDYARERPQFAISHLGFTLHFLHHHLAQDDAAYDYARAYMNVLRALGPRGRFVYTPSLPFLEDMLDRRLYRVQRVKFAGALQVDTLRKLEASTGLSLASATHVARLS